MTVTALDVQDAFLRFWRTIPGLSALVPAGLKAGRVPPETTPPYATMEQPPVPSEIQWTSGTGIQAFTAMVEAYVPNDPNQETARAVADLLGDNVNWQQKKFPKVRNAVAVIGLRPRPVVIRLDPETSSTRDVLVVEAQWDVMVQVPATRRVG